MFILFDLDSTLATIEWLDILAERKWKWAEIKAITDATMDGTMSFDAVFAKKLQTINATVEDLSTLWSYYAEYITPGIPELLAACRARWDTMGIITYNYTIPAQMVAQYLHIPLDYVFGNTIINDTWIAVVDPASPLLHEDGKVTIIRHLRTQFPDERFVFVGDSVGDMRTQVVVDQFIGFGGVCVRPKVLAWAKYFAYDVAQILSFIHSVPQKV